FSFYRDLNPAGHVLAEVVDLDAWLGLRHLQGLVDLHNTNRRLALRPKNPTGTIDDNCMSPPFFRSRDACVASTIRWKRRRRRRSYKSRVEILAAVDARKRDRPRRSLPRFVADDRPRRTIRKFNQYLKNQLRLAERSFEFHI